MKSEMPEWSRGRKQEWGWLHVPAGGEARRGALRPGSLLVFPWRSQDRAREQGRID